MTIVVEIKVIKHLFVNILINGKILILIRAYRLTD